MKLGSKSVACKEKNSHWRCCKNTSIFSFRWSDYWCTILVHPVVKSCVILLCVSNLRHKILKYMCFIVQVQPCFSYKCFVTDSKYISVLCSKVLLEIILIWSSCINWIMSLSFVLPSRARQTRIVEHLLWLCFCLPAYFGGVCSDWVASFGIPELHIYGSCQPLYGPYIDCVNHIWNIDYSKTFQRDIKAWFHCVDIPGPSNLSLVLRILFTISQIDNMVSFDQGCAGGEKGETPCDGLKPFSNGLNIDLFYKCVCI